MAVPERAPRATRPAPERPPAERRRRARRPRVANGIAWIVVVAVVLAGVVAVNVADLRLNLRVDDLDHQRARLQDDNAALAARLSSAGAAARLQSIARARDHLVPAVSPTFLDLSKP